MIWRCDLVPQYEKYRNDIMELTDKIGRKGRYILDSEVREFEAAFAEYLNVKYVVGVANGTEALSLTMMAMGIGKGDEVITTPYTAIPTASAIISTGAAPVFADIDPETFLIDIEKVKEKITPRTKAVIPVHIFGNMVDIEALRKVVGDIPIIEDACQAHGSSIRGKKAGSLGFAAAFSFYPTKNLGGYGDGGAISTNDEELANKLRLTRMYGMVNKDTIVVNGINTRLDELQAAILRRKLADLDDMNLRRRKIAERYQNEITNPNVVFQKTAGGVTPNYHICALKYLGDREKLIERLEKDGIQTNIYYKIPLHLQEANRYLGYKENDLPEAEKLCRQAMAITMYPELKDDTLDYVIERINAFKG